MHIPFTNMRSCEIGDGVRLSNCVILNRVSIKNYARVADSIIGWSSKREWGDGCCVLLLGHGCWGRGRWPSLREGVWCVADSVIGWSIKRGWVVGDLSTAETALHS